MNSRSCRCRRTNRRRCLKIEIKENETKPPARFNEATLLSAMEGAGKLVEDEELREAMRERGLGTPATRAQIIEGLILDGYVERAGKELVVTAKGLSLITLLRNLHTDALSTPELTGEWEFRLKEMATWQARSAKFHERYPPSYRGRSSRRSEISEAKKYMANTPRSTRSARTAAGGPIKEDYKTFRCQNCDWLMWKTMASRQFSPTEVRNC